MKVIDRAPAGRDEARPGRTWSLVTTRKGPEAWEPIAFELASWEAEHRTWDAEDRPCNPSGRFLSVYDAHSVEPEAKQSACGIRRRLVKQANAGDTQATELVVQLSTGQLAQTP